MSDGSTFLIANEQYEEGYLMVFSTLELMIRLTNAEMIVMDGTFKICPMLFRQIYTLHGLVGLGQMKRVVPLVFVLMSNKSELLYRRLFDLFTDLCDDYGLSLAPRYVLTDFESAIIAAVRVKFPSAEHKGCFFHLAQIIYRNVQAKGLQTIYADPESEYSIKVRQIAALAFLSPTEIPGAFDLVKELFDSRANELLGWFEGYYVKGRGPPQFPPSMWSIKSLVDQGYPRSQNEVEGWHRRFLSLAGNKHLGVIKCIELLRDEAFSSIVNITRLESGSEPPMSSKQAEREQRIRTVYENRADRDTLAFLKSLAYNIKPYDVIIEDDREEEEFEDE